MKVAGRCPRGRTAFTLVELMVSVAIIALLMLLMVTITDATRKTWVTTTARAEQFRGARAGFESMTRRLSQATLNTYWDYFDASGNARSPANAATFVPARYARQSELRFVCGQAAALLPSPQSSSCPTHAVFFQAPLGYVNDANYSRMENLLNTWGYFIQFGNDSLLRPTFLPQSVPLRYRFRLMEMMEPSEAMTLYREELAAGGASLYSARTWYSIPFSASPRPVRVVAENIVALLLLPKLTPDDQRAGNYQDGGLAPSYLYDSTGSGMATLNDKNLNPKSQLPPVIQVTMVALEETSFSRFQKTTTTMPAALGLSGLFTTVGSTADPASPGYAKDLQTLQTNLVTSKPALTYRVFTTNVSIKGAKWSREQTN